MAQSMPCGPHLVHLENENLKASVLARGATLNGLWHRSCTHSLVLGYQDPHAYSDDPFYLGAVVGPLANRIANARVVINGHHWQMDSNEGTSCLHGGSSGLSNHVWTVENQSLHSVKLCLKLRDGQGGLPGNRQISITYELKDTALHIDICAQSDKDTFMNPAHHPYWRLDAHATTPAHVLKVFGEMYLPTDANGIPTGEIAPCANTSYDFSTPKPVPVDKPLDANICLRDRRRREPAPAATLASDVLRLEIDTTEPGLQVYNGSGLHDRGAVLHHGRHLEPFYGLALEPQGWPNAPNTPGFPPVLLTAGETYFQRTVYRLNACTAQA